MIKLLGRLPPGSSWAQLGPVGWSSEIWQGSALVPGRPEQFGRMRRTARWGQRARMWEKSAVLSSVREKLWFDLWDFWVPPKLWRKPMWGNTWKYYVGIPFWWPADFVLQATNPEESKSFLPCGLWNFNPHSHSLSDKQIGVCWYIPNGLRHTVDWTWLNQFWETLLAIPLQSIVNGTETIIACWLAMLAAPLLLRLALLGETKMMTSDIPTEKKIGVQLG